MIQIDPEIRQICYEICIGPYGRFAYMPYHDNFLCVFKEEGGVQLIVTDLLGLDGQPSGNILDALYIAEDNI